MLYNEVEMLQQGTQLNPLSKNVKKLSSPRDKAGYIMLHYFRGETQDPPWETVVFSSSSESVKMHFKDGTIIKFDRSL